MTVAHVRLVEQSLADLEQQQGLLRAAWARVDAGNAAIAAAHDQGTSLDSLRTEEDRLLRMEAQLSMRLAEVQRVRREILTHLSVIAALGGTTSSPSGGTGVLTGSWDLTVQPGLTGSVYLVQQGTLVSGTYTLSGGWTGSLRGTLVANKVRLERIDSQLGFAAIFYGEINLQADPDVIQGRWEATQLATGMPSAGGWRAQRKE